jgi:nucleoside-diphosphate-sugar epimerase
MRILVTGAAGSLGTALLPRLAADGHETVAFDVRRGPADASEWVVDDVRDPSAVSRATDGVHIVVHAAALHGIHLRDHSPREFFDLNVGGTFNVWSAAVEHRVRGVVFSSTMGVYGESRKPVSDDSIAFLDEDLPLQPGDVYGWTKVVGEEMCRWHLREHGIPSVALRYGMFVPEPFFRYGIRLLYGGVHEDDVAGSVIAAIASLDRGQVEHEAFNVEAPLAVGPTDGPDLRRRPLEAIDRRYPGSGALLRARGVRSLRPITEIFPVGRLEDRLGFRPAHDFDAWLRELESRPEERTANDPPWP